MGIPKCHPVKVALPSQVPRSGSGWEATGYGLIALLDCTTALKKFAKAVAVRADAEPTA